MGDHSTAEQFDEQRHQNFLRALLDDVKALEILLDQGRIESGKRRIGAEQEFFLIDAGSHPAPIASEILARLDDDSFTTELARFNLESNLPPYPFSGDCLRRLECDLNDRLDRVRAAAHAESGEVLLTGILPTLQLSDLGLDNMAPVPRYALLNACIVKLRGGDFHVRIKGIDELFAVHDNVMLESCNTSFQIHFQVSPEEFVPLYNLAQAVTGPVLAAAANSPLLLGHRLWHETRVALFQHSVDHRSRTHQSRGQRARVRFGDRWVQDSVLEIFREDIARFRVVIASDVGENALDVIEQGETPQLRALCMHNGTVYRWNRPCYGWKDGKAHLRIENRVLPAGPTVIDQVANAAFYYGLMVAFSEQYPDIRKVMQFEDAKGNFLAAARHGLKAQFTWMGGKTESASALILRHLLPDARAGLLSRGIDTEDIDRYLGVLEERVEAGMTGAQWALDSWSGMRGRATSHERCRALTSAMLDRQRRGDPVHTWDLATLEEATDWRHSYKTVGQFMTRDLFTVQPDDLVDLAANVMDWEHVRHVPVEDDEGCLVGIVSHRTLIRLLAQGEARGVEPVPVSRIMKRDPITVGPDTPTLEAIRIMRRHRVACVPVVRGDKLVGILTERDLIEVAAQLLQDHLAGLSELESAEE
ncbi:MAG: glutamate-cysteine ligase family protein [Planctomycetota bacterium]|jgi:CBS domain-containing protein/gamma-glutamylcysteine synthetase